MGELLRQRGLYAKTHFVRPADVQGLKGFRGVRLIGEGGTTEV